MKDTTWMDLFLLDSEKTSRVESVTSEKKKRKKVRQLLSVEPSARKHKSGDIRFEALGYHCLRLRYASLSEEQL